MYAIQRCTKTNRTNLVRNIFSSILVHLVNLTMLRKHNYWLTPRLQLFGNLPITDSRKHIENVFTIQPSLGLRHGGTMIAPRLLRWTLLAGIASVATGCAVYDDGYGYGGYYNQPVAQPYYYGGDGTVYYSNSVTVYPTYPNYYGNGGYRPGYPYYRGERTPPPRYNNDSRPPQWNRPDGNRPSQVRPNNPSNGQGWGQNRPNGVNPVQRPESNNKQPPQQRPTPDRGDNRPNFNRPPERGPVPRPGQWLTNPEDHGS